MSRPSAFAGGLFGPDRLGDPGYALIHGSRGTARSVRRRLTTLAVCTLVSLVSVLGSLGVALFAGGPTTASASDPCPVLDTCVSMPGSNNGSIIASPTSDLVNDQWVNLNFTGFAAGVKVYVYYCTNTAPLTAGSPTCVDNGGSDLPVPENTLFTYPSGPNAGGADIAVQVALSSSAQPFSGSPPNEPILPGPMVCDGTAANPCSLVVEEPDIDGGQKKVTPLSAVVIPLTFASVTGCPNAGLVTTQSEFGIEQLLPEASQLACSASSSPALAFNTAIDGEGAVSALAQGDVQVAFTDDPEAPDQQTALKSIKGGYALIPIALSANVVGFRAEIRELSGLQVFPKSTYSLTPTEVAGLLTSSYASPGASDLADCQFGTSWCTDPDVTACAGSQCSELAELNQDAGFIGAQQYGESVRSDSAGVTHEFFEWLCDAPNTPYDINGVSVTEPDTPANTLVQGLNTNLPPGNAPFTQCPSTSDTFPSLLSAGNQYFSEVAQPFQQEVKLAGGSGLVQPIQLAKNSDAVFAPMNWAEASYNGMTPASLENNSGNFELPTAQTLDDALSGATTNPDGSLAYDFSGAGSSDAYPLPDVIYAAVATAPQSATNVTNERDMLSSILALTGGADSADLPGGFVPLPSSLYSAATADLTKDITTTSPSSSGGGSTGTTKTTTTKSTTATKTTAAAAGAAAAGFAGSGFAACATCSGFSTTGPVSLTTIPPGPTTPRHHHTTGSDGSSSPPAPLPPTVVLEATANRMLLPSLAVLGALIFLWGLLLMSPRARRGVLSAVGAGDRSLRRLFGRPAPGTEAST